MEEFDRFSVSPLEKTSNVSSVALNDLIEKKNSESKRRWVIRIPLESKKAGEDSTTRRNKPSPVDKEEGKKPWNLRPKKDARQQRRFPEKNTAGEPKSKKEIPGRIRKFPVVLSREEIEEDLAFLTGGKRLRKMQKRPRSVHQHNHDLFRGSFLGSITIKSYSLH